MVTTANIEKVYSPAALLAKPTGTKPAAVTSVPVSIGKAVEVYAKVAARTLSMPSSSLVTIISTVIMASSTSRPSAMISAPRDTRCRSISLTCIVTNTAASTSGIEQATTAPARRPRLRKLTPSTMAMASHSAAMKSLTATRTTCGCAATRCGSRPTGNEAVMVRITALTLRPSESTSPPLRIAIPSPMAGTPL